MNNQSNNLNQYVSSSINSIDGEYEDMQVLTFPPKRVDEELELNVQTLTDPTTANALRAADPFAYYSCFTPSNTLTRKMVDVLEAQQREEDPSQPEIIKVTCQRRVSAECDPFALAFRGMQDTKTEVHVDDGEGDMFALLFQSMIGVDIEQEDAQDGDDECDLIMLKKQ